MTTYVCQVKLSIIRQVEFSSDECEDGVDVARLATSLAQREYGIHDEVELLDYTIRPIITFPVEN